MLFTPLGHAAMRALKIDEEMRLWRLVLATLRLQHRDEAKARLRARQTQFTSSPLLGLYQLFAGRIDHHHYRSARPPADRGAAHTFDSK